MNEIERALSARPKHTLTNDELDARVLGACLQAAARSAKRWRRATILVATAAVIILWVHGSTLEQRVDAGHDETRFRIVKIEYLRTSQPPRSATETHYEEERLP